MNLGDARLTIDSNVIADPRVKQFWDGNNIAGTWFAEKVEGYSGVAWDVYYLYGPDAEWSSTPGPLVATSGTVIGIRDDLRAAILPLINQ